MEKNVEPPINPLTPECCSISTAYQARRFKRHLQKSARHHLTAETPASKLLGVARAMSMNKPPLIPLLTRAELHDLARAKALLENPGFTIRLANRLGAPIEKGFALLPKGWSDTVHRAARLSLLKA